MQPIYMTQRRVARKQYIATALPISRQSMFTPYYPYQTEYNYPITINEWQHIQAPLYTVRQVPVVIPTSNPIFPTPFTPLVGRVIQPVLPPVLQQPILPNVSNILTATSERSYSTSQNETLSNILNDQSQYTQDELLEQSNTCNELINIDVQTNTEDPLDSYFNLPKELFPSANMLALDPNPIVHEFCKIVSIEHHVPWLLDLEFGIPRTATSRTIPIYNVQYNSINCRNAPKAIHPGFESCDTEFKNALLFYYDCIISSWYYGYSVVKGDRSVENFQEWLLVPMQRLGVCWP